MIVDDSSSMRRLTKLALNGAGHTVLEAADGKAALALLDGRSIQPAAQGSEKTEPLTAAAHSMRTPASVGPWSHLGLPTQDRRKS